jgi:hypothetical protein
MMLIFLIGVLVIVHIWILWDIILRDWKEMDISISIEELEHELYNDLHLQRRDDD